MQKTNEKLYRDMEGTVQSVDFLFQHTALLERHDELGRNQFPLLGGRVHHDAFHFFLHFENAEGGNAKLCFIVHVFGHFLNEHIGVLLHLFGRHAQFVGDGVDKVFVVHCVCFRIRQVFPHAGLWNMQTCSCVWQLVRLFTRLAA